MRTNSHCANRPGTKTFHDEMNLCISSSRTSVTLYYYFGDFNEKRCKLIYICLAENNEFIFEPSREVGVIV